ncbi:MAG: nuclear transport factor 2 family protein [Erythrobacter sp.]
MAEAKEVVHAYLTALWASDREAAKARLADDCEWYFLPSLGYPTPMSGHDATDAVLDDMMAALDGDAEFSVEWNCLLGDERMVAAEYTARGTDAKGAAYENRYCLRADVVDGKIVEIRPYTDTKKLSDLMDVIQ